MCYTIIPTDIFKKDVKYYLKKKKYTNILKDIEEVICELETGNLIGDLVDSINCDGEAYKIRVANSNTKSGKSNGYRIIYYAIKNDLEIYLLTIYYKKDDIRVLDKKEISDIINKYCN
nr:hypothetical protein [Sedimentibacter sp.]